MGLGDREGDCRVTGGAWVLAIARGEWSGHGWVTHATGWVYSWRVGFEIGGPDAGFWMSFALKSSQIYYFGVFIAPRPPVNLTTVTGLIEKPKLPFTVVESGNHGKFSHQKAPDHPASTTYI